MTMEKFHHPSKDIIETKGTILRGKTICMCLTGSVAVISAPIIARELMRLGAEVVGVMSKAATELGKLAGRQTFLKKLFTEYDLG